MSIIATEHPLIPTDAIQDLEGMGYKVFISTEHTLEAGNGVQVLQVIRLEDGEYRASQIPQSSDSPVKRTDTVIPEMGHVLKWLRSEGAES